MLRKKRDELDHGCVLDVKTMILMRNAPELFSIYKYFVEELKVDTPVVQFI